MTLVTRQNADRRGRVTKSWLTLVIPGLLIGAYGSDRPRRAAASASGSPASGQDGEQHSRPCKIRLTPIVNGRLGVLHVGMTTDELRAACRQAVTQTGTDEEGSPVTLYAIPVSNRDTVFADLDTLHGHEVVRSFSIGFVGPRTVDGIAVGSTCGEIKRRYRDLGADDNEGRVYVWPEPDRGISFALSVGRDALAPGWRETPRVIPDSAHVIELLIRAPTREP
jgi:hypothetical protein